MALSAGTTLGPYEILAPIGKGGMGEVYRARDTKLDRDVAIKVLPDEVANDAERVARFEREAKLLAALNHPNIAGIYGFESHALILELVEGSTLAERIERGPIPFEESIAIAKQITLALEAGHEAGIVHRDLKPANIKLKEDGTVKLLDYGLAKAMEIEGAAEDSDLSQSPTLTRQGTRVGVILGTAAYMSPEQAKGKRVDRRADNWAFGCVLYEMLTGRRAFEAEEVSETLAFVLTREPDWDALPEATPGPVRRVLQLCLTKDRAQRIRDIADVRLALDGAFESDLAESDAGAKPHAWAVALFAALAGAALSGLLVGRSAPPASTAPAARLEVSPPEGRRLSNSGSRILDISRDGSRIVFASDGGLYLRSLSESEAHPIGGAQSPRTPFLSPDGEWVGYFTENGLKKIPIGGGSPVHVADSSLSFGAHWADDDTIVFAPQTGGGVFRVSPDGGAPEVLVAVPREEGLVYAPQMLAGGRAVLFTLSLSAWDTASMVIQGLETNARRTVVEGGRGGRFLSSGHVVFARRGSLFALPFDLDRLEPTGGPVPVVENVKDGGWFSGGVHYCVSDIGSLVYVPDEPMRRRLVWVDRDGNEEPVGVEPGAYANARLSPDGSRVALEVWDDEYDIWVWDFRRETFARLTSHAAIDGDPVWTPDGERIAFSSTRDGGYDIYWRSADGAGAAEKLVDGVDLFPRFFDSAGKNVYASDGVSSPRLRGFSIPDAKEVELAAELQISSPALSPDERWLAYLSNPTGRLEVYISPFPDIEAARTQVSQGGGTSPAWSPDGGELYFATAEGTLMASAVHAGARIDLETPTPLFRGSYALTDGIRTYDVAPDGSRYLMIKEDEDRQREKLLVVLNWFQELERLAPTE